MQSNLKLRYGRNDVESLFHDEIVLKICSTSAFKRLRNISFLGAIDREPGFRNFRHNRFDHSIGVALLAQNYAEKLELPSNDRLAIILAALLHDIGHAPLSHSLEPVFEEKFGLNHHVATSNLIEGRVALGKDLNLIIRSSGLTAERIIELISGADKSLVGRIFSSPINVDTMEAIWRGGTYLSKKFIHPSTVLAGFIDLESRSGGALERFWSDKNTFYQLMIYGQRGAEADYAARSWARNLGDKLRPDDFYLSEKSFFKERPPLYLDNHSEEYTFSVKTRKFETNPKESLVSHESLSKKFMVTRGVKKVTARKKTEANHPSQIPIW